MTSDDLPHGHLLSRREVVALLGATGAACLADPEGTFANTPAPLCVVRPEQTVGPYFVDERLHRSDIRSDPTNGQVKPGTPLTLTLLVSRLRGGTCQPLEGVQVDLWQCDAAGVYSDAEDPRFSTLGQKFLRGYQITDGAGEARFVTIYPGWYPGRTVHIHFKVRTDPRARRGYDFTSQLYFDDDLTDRVHASAAYAARGQRRTRNQRDGIFRRGGEELMLAMKQTAAGYAGSIALALQLP